MDLISAIIAIALLQSPDWLGDAAPVPDWIGPTRLASPDPALGPQDVEHADAAKGERASVIYYPDNCDPCTADALAKLKAAGLAVRVLKPPAWCKTPPVCHWEASGRWWQVRWIGSIDDFVGAWQKTQDAPKAEPVSVTYKLPAAQRYPTHRQIYDIEGDWNASWQKIFNHLLTGSEHRDVRAKFSRGQLSRMTRAELLSVHDDSHRRNLRDLAAVKAKQQMVSRRRVACPTCPGGWRWQ